ncbi:hypothetical protein IEQ_04875 [Bacillus cereus BAG6X1-2]|nr:hypothetical protein IEQ_04875 [Bacillus cereus BAG6X1-2]
MKKNFLSLSGFEKKIMICENYSFLSTEEIEADTDEYFADKERIPEGLTLDIIRNGALRHLQIQDISGTCLKEDFSNWADFYKVPTHKLIDMSYELHLGKHSDDTNNILAQAGYPEILIKSESLRLDMKSYTPFNMGHSLFTELPKIKIWDLKSLKRFSKVYGLPTGYGIYRTDTSYGSKDILFTSAPLIELFVELTIYRYIFRLFLAIKTKDTEQLQIMERFKAIRRKQAPSSILQDEDTLLFNGTARLTYLLNKYNRVFQKLFIGVINGKTEITPIVQFVDLFDIAYFQMTKSLLQNTELRKCEYCGHYFESDHERRRFCHPLPFRKRSSCETAYNRKKTKEKTMKKGE